MLFSRFHNNSSKCGTEKFTFHFSAVFAKIKYFVQKNHFQFEINFCCPILVNLLLSSLFISNLTITLNKETNKNVVASEKIKKGIYCVKISKMFVSRFWITQF